MKYQWAGAIILFFLTPLALSPVYASVVINEIFPKPTDPVNQWIELYNTGTDPVSLNLWKLENSAGNSFIIPASGIIAGKGFYTVSKSQTAINLKENGDTVRLLNENGSLVDSESYPSTLGTNNSVGRSPDGGAGMTVCTTNTYNLPNNCPVPTPTIVPTATPLPTLTPIPADLSSEALAKEEAPPNPSAPNAILGVSLIPTHTPTPTLDENYIMIQIPKTVKLSRMLVLQVVAVAVSWIVLAIIAKIHGSRKRRKKRTVNPVPDSGPLPH